MVFLSPKRFNFFKKDVGVGFATSEINKKHKKNKVLDKILVDKTLGFGVVAAFVVH